jgi:hypothetical protein
MQGTRKKEHPKKRVRGSLVLIWLCYDYDGVVSAPEYRDLCGSNVTAVFRIINS